MVLDAAHLLGGNDWIQLPPMSTARTGHGCGVVRDYQSGGRQVIVAGGFVEGWRATDRVEVLDLDARKWRYG